jgi:hypothetical protein
MFDEPEDHQQLASSLAKLAAYLERLAAYLER